MLIGRHPRFTVRELEAITLLASVNLGMTDSEIAERMHITVGTLRTMWKRIFWKLSVYDRTGLSRYELALNWNFPVYQIGLRELGLATDDLGN